MIADNENDFNEMLKNSVEGGTLYDIALVVYYLYKDKYKTGRLRNKLWFQFDGVKWKQIEEGPYYELSSHIMQYYEKFLNIMIAKEVDYEVELTKSNFEEVKTEIEKNLRITKNVIQSTKKTITKLKNVNCKESICKECLYLFYDPDFINNLDKKEHLICFKNGVYDMNTKELRKGCPDDMISLSIDHDYDGPNNEDDTRKVNEIIDKFINFRKNIMKKRYPKNMYSV